MTDEEIREASIDYQLSTNPLAIGGDAFADMAREMNVNPSFIAGVKWAEKEFAKQKHPDGAKTGEWIDYNMLISEIGMHRRNAQSRIKEYRELEKQRRLSEGETIEYAKCVGEEVILMCLQQWCSDFRFSTDELKEFEEFKR